MSVREYIGPSTGNSARINVEDNKVVVGNQTIPNIWLRDNCQCSSCMHDSTKQRLQDTFAIPKDLSIRSASLTKEKDVHRTDLEIVWSDGHESRYTQPFLAKTLESYDRRSIVRQGLTDPKLWDSSIASDPPIELFDNENGTGAMLENIRKFGFCYVDKTPFDTPAPTEALLGRIAFIRETHYGGFYDFTADLASKDTAYTNIALEAHTDNTYFSDPAGLQAFHLLSHTDGSGGASLLVDGFKVAAELLQQDTEAYNILSTVNVHAHASGNEGISIQPYRGFPVLEHDPATGDLLRVRWNSSDRASIELPIEEVETWYDAARKFDALLKKKENEYWEQLTPGRVLIFDNWRVLHGRSEFTGKRRICGGYINRDDWMSRFKMHSFGQEKVMGSLASS
ncbi:Trimethyllysine dioxygenase [Lizonia empirigonia]|nr:Trimethyllysine dioxygenase [Lizonia empirigonia]